MPSRALAASIVFATTILPIPAAIADDDRMSAFKACHFEFSVAKAILYTLETHYPETRDLAELRPDFEARRKAFGADYLRYALREGVDISDGLGDPTPSNPDDYDTTVALIQSAHAESDAGRLRARYDEAIGCHPVE